MFALAFSFSGHTGTRFTTCHNLAIYVEKNGLNLSSKPLRGLFGLGAPPDKNTIPDYAGVLASCPHFFSRGLGRGFGAVAAFFGVAFSSYHDGGFGTRSATLLLGAGLALAFRFHVKSVFEFDQLLQTLRAFANNLQPD